MQEWPLISKLDPKEYGPPESAITKEIVEEQIRGSCTLEEVRRICYLKTRCVDRQGDHRHLLKMLINDKMPIVIIVLK